MSHKRAVLLVLLVIVLSAMTAVVGQAWTSQPVKLDPLVRLPGTQPGQVTLESPNRCLNCHSGYNTEVEPGFNWQGSMMAQSARDFLFWSAMTVAAQDAVWAVGTPNATDICLRCHFPKGWLEGRSDPTNASLMTGADYDGVQCDFCHTMWDPFFEETHAGTRESSEWLAYWDETNNSGTPSQPAADETYAADKALSQDISRFDGLLFYADNTPFSGNYTESAGGQYFVSPNSQKRASFADASARHQMLYSRFHKSKYMCATCHDVSNPVLANLGLSGLEDGGEGLITEQYSAANYFHVERTFSEFTLSAYGQQGGAAGIGPFAPESYDTSSANNNIAKCQDCHMRDVTGVAANKNGAIDRPSQSVEHPESGQPLHDLTGGNVWVSTVLASAIAGSPNYDATNDQLLNQGAAVLTLDVSLGQGIDPTALLAGADRAKQQLLLAASIDNVSYDSGSGSLSFRVQNQTGHKLISGFPEGRRMFVNIKAYDADGSLIYEVNPYDVGAGTLKGLPHALSSPPLATNEVYADELVYEMHPSSTLTGENESFHFVLSDDRYKDNRIPPKGFDIANAAARLAQPRWENADAPDYFTAAEYAGGYDEVALTIANGAASVVINLYYQTTSREYIEFLRDEIGGVDNLTLYGPDNPTTSSHTLAYELGLNLNDDNAYLAQSDQFFGGLRAWGDTIWQLWTHNMNLDGARPFLMTQATVGTTSGGCLAPTPTLDQAQAGNQQVVLSWTAIDDPTIAGYKVYYDQANKAQLVTSIADPNASSYTDSGLTNGQEYCYKATTYYDATCESGFSNIICATPQNQGQTTDPAGVNAMETGYWSGKGKNQNYVVTSSFAAGDTVVVRARVVDAGGAPIANATVEITIGGPEAVTLNSNPSDANGWAEISWQTQSPNRKGQGGTTAGSYTASTTNVTASGYHWDTVTTSTTFTIQ
jgi:hypothetical protein